MALDLDLSTLKVGDTVHIIIPGSYNSAVRTGTITKITATGQMTVAHANSSMRFKDGHEMGAASKWRAAKFITKERYDEINAQFALEQRHNEIRRNLRALAEINPINKADVLKALDEVRAKIAAL